MRESFGVSMSENEKSTKRGNTMIKNSIILASVVIATGSLAAYYSKSAEFEEFLRWQKAFEKSYSSSTIEPNAKTVTYFRYRDLLSNDQRWTNWSRRYPGFMPSNYVIDETTLPVCVEDKTPSEIISHELY